jgi:hypothetical protein
MATQAGPGDRFGPKKPEKSHPAAAHLLAVPAAFAIVSAPKTDRALALRFIHLREEFR